MKTIRGEIVTGVLLVLALVSTGGWAWTKMTESGRNRKVATQAAQVAEEARQKAEKAQQEATQARDSAARAQALAEQELLKWIEAQLAKEKAKNDPSTP